MKLTKEQAIEKIEELKKFVAKQDNKVEEKVIGLAIKNRWIGSIIFQSTKTTYKEAVAEKLAIDANLRDADLRDAELACAKFYGKGGTKPLKRSQLPAFLGALGFIIED